MVGGFVQHEKVGLKAEDLRQVGPHDPAARHLAGWPIEILLPEAQSRQDLAPLRFELKPVHEGELVLGFGIFPGIEGACRFVLAHDPLHFTHLGRNGSRDLQNGVFARITSLLGEIADVGMLIAFHPPGTGHLVAEDNLEEGRLARPVGADQRNALTPVDGQISLLEERPPTVGHGQLANGQHVSGAIAPITGKSNGEGQANPAATTSFPGLTSSS